MVCGASLEVLRILREDPEPRRRLVANEKKMRDGFRSLGFDVDPGEHPIVPIHFRNFDDDAILAQKMSADLLDEGIYVIGFSFPVVPKGQARIRLQLSAAHTDAQIDRCLEAFAKVGRRHGVIG